MRLTDGGVSVSTVATVLDRSPAWQCKLLDEITDIPWVKTIILKDVTELGISRAAYNAMFNFFHPAGSIQELLRNKYQERWAKHHLLNSCQLQELVDKAVRNLAWLSKPVPPIVHMSNVRLHFNGWHTHRRYQRNLPCEFCKGPSTLDCLEHYFSCRTLMEIFPVYLHCRSGGRRRVPIQSWFLLELDKPAKLVMALYIHAIYKL